MTTLCAVHQSEKLEDTNDMCTIDIEPPCFVLTLNVDKHNHQSVIRGADCIQLVMSFGNELFITSNRNYIVHTIHKDIRYFDSW